MLGTCKVSSIKSNGVFQSLSLKISEAYAYTIGTWLSWRKISDPVYMDEIDELLLTSWS